MKARIATTAFALTGGLFLTQAAQAGVIVTIEAPGVTSSQTPLSVGGVETFNGLVGVATTFSTDFGTGGAITGTYTGFDNFQGSTYTFVTPGDQYGGAGGSDYADTYGSYSLDLSSTLNPGGVTYFGLYLSAIDFGNEIQLYDGATLAQTLTASNLYAHLTDPAYLGDQFGEPFVFINFYATGATAFDKVVISEFCCGGLESDNHTVGFYTAITGAEVPEPAAWALMIAGFGLTGAALRRRRAQIA